jgi:hypothetical protein
VLSFEPENSFVSFLLLSLRSPGLELGCSLPLGDVGRDIWCGSRDDGCEIKSAGRSGVLFGPEWRPGFLLYTGPIDLL